MPERYGPGWPQRFAEALLNLRLMGRRAWLALLGIGVGCAAVVALLNMGHGAAQHVQALFKGMGSELMVVELERQGRGNGAVTPDLTDVSAYVRVVAPLIVAASTVQRPGLRQDAMVVGSTAQLAAVLGLAAREGRLLSVHDVDSLHVVLGASLAAQLAARPGQQLQMGHYLFHVVGVLAATGDNPLLPIMLDQAVLMPLSGMHRLMPAPEVGLMLALGLDPHPLAQSAERLVAHLQAQLPQHQVTVRLPSQLLEGMTGQSQMLNGLLAGFAGIALLLGGVGVMNVMLMNVAERRREIGLRLALGARARDIGWSFLLEALLLSCTGALGGAVAGLLAAWLFAWWSGWPLSLAIYPVPLGVAASLVSGLLSGLYPALAAARLLPVEALREE